MHEDPGASHYAVHPFHRDTLEWSGDHIMPSGQAAPFVYFSNVPRDWRMDRAVARTLANAGYAPGIYPAPPSRAEGAAEDLDGGLAAEVVVVLWSPADD